MHRIERSKRLALQEHVWKIPNLFPGRQGVELAIAKSKGDRGFRAVRGGEEAKNLAGDGQYSKKDKRGSDFSIQKIRGLNFKKGRDAAREGSQN